MKKFSFVIFIFLACIATFSVGNTPIHAQSVSELNACPCDPPADTHGWTDNMCFHKPRTPNCPQTFPKTGYCDPNGDGSYQDADWVRGYYDYRSVCPNSITRPPPTLTISPNLSPTTVISESAITPTIPLTPTESNGQCWVTIGDRFRRGCKGEVECIRRVNDTMTKLINYFKGECSSSPIYGSNPSEAASLTGALYPTQSDGETPIGLNDLLNPTEPPHDQFRSSIQTCLANKGLYQEAIAMAKQIHGIPDIPWQFLAGIHYIEGNCNTNQSVISGRKIGVVEPDRAGTCSPQDTALCRTIPVGEGCGYRSLLESACDAARIFIRKQGGGPTTTIADLARGLAGYNTWGNVNCGNAPGYTACPPYYKGEDHPYAFNLFDQRHAKMWLIYCDGDGVKTPCLMSRPGALSMIKWVSWMSKH